MYFLYFGFALAITTTTLAMEKTKEQAPASFTANLINGGFAGGAEVMANNPLIVLTNKLISINTVKPAIQQERPAAKTLQELAKMLAKALPEIARTYYKGCGAGVVSMVPITAFQNSQAIALAHLFGTDGDLSKKTQAGFIAGFFSFVLSSPADLVVLQRQNEQFKSESLRDTIKRINATRGLATFYRGGTTTGTRDAFFTAAFTTGGDLVQEAVPASTGNKTVDKGLANALVATLSAVFSHPTHVVSARMKGDLAKSIYKSTIQTVKLLLEKEGPTVFMKGVTPRTLRILLAVPLLNALTEKEIGMKFVNTALKKREDL